MRGHDELPLSVSLRHPRQFACHQVQGISSNPLGGYYCYVNRSFLHNGAEALPLSLSQDAFERSSAARPCGRLSVIMQTVAAGVRPFQFSPTTAARPCAVPIIHACLPQSSATGRMPCTRVRAVKGSPSSGSRLHQQAVRVRSRNQLAGSLGDVSLYQAQKRSTAAIIWISRAESLPPARRGAYRTPR